MKRSLNILCANCLFTPLPNTTVCECISCGVLYCDECLTKDFYCTICQKRNLKVSKLASRIIGNRLVTCEFCNTSNIPYKTLMSHSTNCISWKFECNQTSCNFKGNNSQFLTHIQECHFDQVLNLFDKQSKLNQNLNVTLNNTSNTKFYKGDINESNVVFNNNCSNIDYYNDSFSQINNPYQKTGNNFGSNNDNFSSSHIVSNSFNSKSSNNFDNNFENVRNNNSNNNQNMSSSSFKKNNGNDKDCIIF